MEPGWDAQEVVVQADPCLRDRTSLECRHARGVQVAAGILLGEPSWILNEEMGTTLVTKFPPKDHTNVSVTAAAAVLVNATDVEDGSAPPWHPDDEFAS